MMATATVRAEQTKIEALLVWGTNDETSPNPDHRALEKELAERLGKVFKWKSYFLVTTNSVVIKDDGSVQKLKLSDKAVLEIRSLDGEKFEIKLIGKDKLVTTRTEVIKKGDLTALAGDVKKTDCAWFILIRQK